MIASMRSTRDAQASRCAKRRAHARAGPHARRALQSTLPENTFSIPDRSLAAATALPAPGRSMVVDFLRSEVTFSRETPVIFPRRSGYESNQVFVLRGAVSRITPCAGTRAVELSPSGSDEQPQVRSRTSRRAGRWRNDQPVGVPRAEPVGPSSPISNGTRSTLAAATSCCRPGTAGSALK